MAAGGAAQSASMMQEQPTHTLGAKGRKRKVFTKEERMGHSVVEKRRRENLNQKLLHLARNLPPLAPMNLKRLSKNMIIQAAIEHVVAERKLIEAALPQLHDLLEEHDGLHRECDEWRTKAGLACHPRDRRDEFHIRELFVIRDYSFGTFPYGFSGEKGEDKGCDDDAASNAPDNEADNYVATSGVNAFAQLFDEPKKPASPNKPKQQKSASPSPSSPPKKKKPVPKLRPIESTAEDTFASYSVSHVPPSNVSGAAGDDPPTPQQDITPVDSEHVPINAPQLPPFAYNGEAYHLNNIHYLGQHPQGATMHWNFPPSASAATTSPATTSTSGPGAPHDYGAHGHVFAHPAGRAGTVPAPETAEQTPLARYLRTASEVHERPLPPPEPEYLFAPSYEAPPFEEQYPDTPFPTGHVEAHAYAQSRLSEALDSQSAALDPSQPPLAGGTYDEANRALPPVDRAHTYHGDGVHQAPPEGAHPAGGFLDFPVSSSSLDFLVHWPQ